MGGRGGGGGGGGGERGAWEGALGEEGEEWTSNRGAVAGKWLGDSWAAVGTVVICESMRVCVLCVLCVYACCACRRLLGGSDVNGASLGDVGRHLSTLNINGGSTSAISEKNEEDAARELCYSLGSTPGIKLDSKYPKAQGTVSRVSGPLRVSRASLVRTVLATAALLAQFVCVCCVYVLRARVCCVLHMATLRRSRNHPPPKQPHSLSSPRLYVIALSSFSPYVILIVSCPAISITRIPRPTASDLSP